MKVKIRTVQIKNYVSIRKRRVHTACTRSTGNRIFLKEMRIFSNCRNYPKSFDMSKNYSEVAYLCYNNGEYFVFANLCMLLSVYLTIDTIHSPSYPNVNENFYRLCARSILHKVALML